MPEPSTLGLLATLTLADSVTSEIAARHSGRLDRHQVIDLKLASQSCRTHFERLADRHALASAVAEAWVGPRAHVGDLSSRDWGRAYRVVDALLGTEASDPA